MTGKFRFVTLIKIEYYVFDFSVRIWYNYL